MRVIYRQRRQYEVFQKRLLRRDFLVPNDQLLRAAGTVSFEDTVSLTATGALRGAAAVTFTDTFDLTGAGVLRGTPSVSFVTSATLTAEVTGGISAAEAITFADTVSLTASGALRGAESVTFAHSATPTAIGALRGAESVTFTNDANLTDAGIALIGTVSFSFEQSATLKASGALRASVDLELDATGDLGAGRPIEGAATITFAHSATLTDASVLPAATLAGSLAGLSEHQLRTYWQTLDVHLTNTTWVSGQSFRDIEKDIMAGVSSAQNEPHGWNVEFRDRSRRPHIKRVSDTHVRISYFGAPAYQISANETLTVTIPAGAVSSGVAITASPTIVITAISEINPIVNADATTDVPSHYEICDFSGFRAKPGELKETWNGYKVLPRFWEARHPQDFVRSKPDEIDGSERPEQTDTFIEDEYPNGVSAADL